MIYDTCAVDRRQPVCNSVISRAAVGAVQWSVTEGERMSFECVNVLPHSYDDTHYTQMLCMLQQCPDDHIDWVQMHPIACTTPCCSETDSQLSQLCVEQVTTMQDDCLH